MIPTRKALFAIPALILGAGLFGCADNEVGSAPEVKVTSEQRSKDLNDKAESTTKWLEGMPAADRQAAVSKMPQVSEALKGATDPALKQRIAALGVKS